MVEKHLNFCFVKHGCLEGNWQILQKDVQFCNLKNFCLPEWMSWSMQCTYLQTPSKLKRSKNKYDNIRVFQGQNIKPLTTHLRDDVL